MMVNHGHCIITLCMLWIFKSINSKYKNLKRNFLVHWIRFSQNWFNLAMIEKCAWGNRNSISKHNIKLKNVLSHFNVQVSNAEFRTPTHCSFFCRRSYFWASIKTIGQPLLSRFADDDYDTKVPFSSVTRQPIFW